MPKLYTILGYAVFFWSNESVPLEPVHVHVAEGKAHANATKLWITQDGRAILENNNSAIPEKKLHIIMDAVAAEYQEIINRWIDYFGEVTFYEGDVIPK